MKNLTPTAVLYWTEKILVFSLFFQTVELFQIRKTFSEKGVWRWSILKKDLGFLGFFLKYENFLFILSIRVVAALFVLLSHDSGMHRLALLYLFFSSVLIGLRWRGTFNGGSDSLALIVLLSLCLSQLFPKNTIMMKACLWYVVVQFCFSYVVAGLSKVRISKWRNGQALLLFLKTSIYDTQKLNKVLQVWPKLPAVIAWSVMIFECSFPLALFSPGLCIFYMTLGLFFHGMNVYIFGLNRFLFVWLAAYPALYYCSFLS